MAAPNRKFSLIWEKNYHHQHDDDPIQMPSGYYIRIIIQLHRKPLDFLRQWLSNDLSDSWCEGWASVDFVDHMVRIGNHIHVYNFRPYHITTLADPDSFSKIGSTVWELIQSNRRR